MKTVCLEIGRFCDADTIEIRANRVYVKMWMSRRQIKQNISELESLLDIVNKDTNKDISTHG